MTGIGYLRVVVAACAVVSFAGLGASCNLNPQPFPPQKGGDFTGNPVVGGGGGGDDAGSSTGDDGGGALYLGGDGAAPRFEAGSDSASPVSADAATEGGTVDGIDGAMDAVGPADAEPADGESGPTDSWQPAEGGQ